MGKLDKSKASIFITLALILAITLAVCPDAKAVTITSSTQIHLLAPDTYIFWSANLTCTSLSWNATYASFSNVTLGSGNILFSLVISQQNANITLSNLYNGNQKIEYILQSNSPSNQQSLIYNSAGSPSKVFVNGSSYSGWTYAVNWVNLIVFGTLNSIELEYSSPQGKGWSPPNPQNPGGNNNPGGTESSPNWVFLVIIIVIIWLAAILGESIGRKRKVRRGQTEGREASRGHRDKKGATER